MVVVVAGGVASVLQKVFSVFHLLCTSAGEISFALLGHYVGDKSALAFEVVAHGLRFILAALVGEYRGAYEFAGGVGQTDGIHIAVGHVHRHLFGLELHVAIVEFGVAIHICRVATLHYHGVLCREFHHIVEVDLLAAYQRAGRSVDAGGHHSCGERVGVYVADKSALQQWYCECRIRHRGVQYVGYCVGVGYGRAAWHGHSRWHRQRCVGTLRARRSYCAQCAGNHRQSDVNM